MIRSAVLSPTGVRAAFEARGEIFTVPAEKGQPRNLTQTPARTIAARCGRPTARSIAWLSDASGEYQLMIGEQTGVTQAARDRAAVEGRSSLRLPGRPTASSCCSRTTICNLWAIDVASGAATKLDTDTYDDPGRRFDAAWSPDSRWVAYSKSLDSHLRAIFLYSIADKRAHQVTDGLSDAIAPAFDAGGKYLYFLASTNYALRTGWLEMSSVDRPATRADLSGRAERRASRRRSCRKPATSRARRVRRRWRQAARRPRRSPVARRHQGHRSADSRARRARRRLRVAGRGHRRNACSTRKRRARADRRR